MANGENAVIINRQLNRPPIVVNYPEVTGLGDRDVQESINRTIRQEVDRLILAQGGGREDLVEMLGTYRITLNQRGVLSIRFENFSYIRMAAHPTTVVSSLTFDLGTGEVYSLGDLFNPAGNYRILIRNMIRRQIEERNIPVFNQFNLISDNQSYYLTEDALVLYFQEAEIAPRYLGIIEFPLPYAKLANVINEEGPLGRFI